MKNFLSALRPHLQRIADAMVFANAGNFREFEELLREGERRELAQRRATPGYHGPAARRLAQRRAGRPAGAAFSVPALMPLNGTPQAR